MGGRSRSSFTKRLKERSRQEKQQEKAERKKLRKLEKQSGVPGELGENPEMFTDESGSEEEADSSPEDLHEGNTQASQ
jgi:hypothetical protein